MAELIKEQITRGKRFVHIPYGSIENSYRIKYMTEVHDEYASSHPDALWVVTEKVDGTNCALQCDGTDVTVFKRTGALRFSKRHTPCWFPKQITPLYPILCPLVFDIRRLCKEQIDPKTDIVICFGEMYGEGIQAGNERYGPGNGYYPFDIAIKTIDGTVTFLTYKQFQGIMEQTGWKVYSIPLHIGTFDECMSYDIRFHSTIPRLRGIILDDPGSIVEGVVPKPYDQVVYTSKGRLVIKIKNVEFEEIQRRSRWHFSVPGGPHQKASMALKQHWGQVVDTWPLIEPYVTYRRLESVISKVGTGQPDHYYKINLMDDALEEYERDHEGWKDILHPDVVIKLNRFTSDYCREIVEIHGVISQIWSDLRVLVTERLISDLFPEPIDKNIFLDTIVDHILTTFKTDHSDPKLPSHGIEEIRHMVSLLSLVTSIYG